MATAATGATARLAKMVTRLRHRPVPLSKVQLHVHLDGAVRTQTLWEVAAEKKYPLPSWVRSVDDLHKLVTVPRDERTTLPDFLDRFFAFFPIIRADGDALERIAFEFMEDQRKDGVAYAEVRYSPHLLARDQFTPDRVVHAVNRGLERGRLAFGVEYRSILCCMRAHPEWSMDVVDLVRDFQHERVVGIDLAGDESFPAAPHAPAFRYAREHHVHRTVHAGEVGPASNVVEAIELLHAERIGHGYHVLQDRDAYQMVLDRDIHLETSITSSLQTGAAYMLDQHGPDASADDVLKSHAVLQFAHDRANFGLNTDDPGVCNTDLTREYNVAFNEIGLDHSMLSLLTFNAARSAFLPADDAEDLMARLLRNHFNAATDEWLPSEGEEEEESE